MPIIVTWQRPLGAVEKPAALSFGWHLCSAVLAAKEDGCREPVSHRRTQKALWSGERGVAMLNIQSWRAGSYSEKVGSGQVSQSPSPVWLHTHGPRTNLHVSPKKASGKKRKDNSKRARAGESLTQPLSGPPYLVT